MCFAAKGRGRSTTSKNVTIGLYSSILLSVVFGIRSFTSHVVICLNCLVTTMHFPFQLEMETL